MSPLGSNLLVQTDEPEKQTESGILLAGAQWAPVAKAAVLAVGPGLLLDSGVMVPLTCKVGDRVLYPLHSGTEVDPKERLRIMDERLILAVIEENE
jgi:co-chaperonin GroES (HSP10)